MEAEDEERQWAARCGSSLGSSFYHFIAGDPEPRLVLSSVSTVAVSPSSRGVSNLALSEDTEVSTVHLHTGEKGGDGGSGSHRKQFKDNLSQMIE